jgi:hypothetical protein
MFVLLPECRTNHNIKTGKTSQKMAVFWDVAPCSLVDIEQFSEERTASIIRVMMTD